MVRPGLNISAHSALRLVLAAGFLLLLAVNLPGHLSQDSVAQLYEGRFKIRETWGPAVYAWVLGLGDAIVPGTALYVVASALLLFLSLASFPALRRRVGWLGVAVTAGVILTPQVLIYQAIVWKDVLFANCAVAGMVLVAHAAGAWAEPRRRWLLLGGAVVLLAMASLVRQNGAVVPLFAALAVGWVGGQGRFWKGLAWALGLIVAVLLMAQVLTKAAEPPNAPPDTAMNRGVRILQHYDLVGAVTLDRSYRLERIAAADRRAADLVYERAPLTYSGERVDFVGRDEAIGAAIWALPNEVVRGQWLDLIRQRPDLYLRVRFEDFRWVFLTPIVDRCLPLHVGVDAAADKMKALDLTPRRSRADGELANYLSWYLDTPLYSHVAFAVVALALAGVFLLRRDPADIAMAALMLSALAFAASFFVISIACDYRYLYFTDLAALVGLAYIAADPGVGRTRRRRR